MKRISVFKEAAILALLIVVLCVTQCQRTTYPTPPFLVPIRLDQKGVVADLNFEITEYWHYVFYIRFYFPEEDRNERARVKKIIGDTGQEQGSKDFDPGVLTPIKLSIFKEEEQSWVLIHEKEITPTLTFWGSGSFGKVLEGRKLAVGKYRIILESFAQPIEYASIPTKFGISMFKYGK